jgi:pyruvate/2-oxoglutarate/acetoin dehydrogenase E1 component/TPP-dependent pyruvate/acetoin dehydrogenase alpha subunit
MEHGIHMNMSPENSTNVGSPGGNTATVASRRAKTADKGDAAGKNRLGLNADEIKNDYRIGYMSRQASLIGRKEVLTGKAKFGIFGDGKEVAQLAMARAFRKGDWRSGYYRDQTFMFATGACTIKQFFAQLFADTSLDHDPASGGRQMNNHFATRYLTADGEWSSQKDAINTSADISPTGGQMARLLGLAYASKIYRQNPDLAGSVKFSVNGDEVAFGTIGNASTSEGLFWETMNAAGVLQVPLLMSVWDDEYGISVPAQYQTTKQSISKVMDGFRSEPNLAVFHIQVVKGWDYPALVEAYAEAVKICRHQHMPVLFHVVEMTQPQGHSTSGSHERYKSKERLAWEESIDCLKKMREWMIAEGIATTTELDKMEAEGRKQVESWREEAWREYLAPIEAERERVIALYDRLKSESQQVDLITRAAQELTRTPSLMRRNIHASMRRTLIALRDEMTGAKEELRHFLESYARENQRRYSSHVFCETTRSPLAVPEVKPVYGANPEKVDGRQVIQKFFEIQLARDPRVFIVGEDIGKLGGVNLEFEGLQAKFGEIRVTDTGIREATILGQGIGAAMRGLRPVVDIQYLDYLLFCFQGMSDDLATLHHRTVGGQVAPVVVRTKGHRLEGIWHTGSPMGMILSGIRGIHVCVPRNMVQAAGFYNTLFKGDDPALVIEVLNGYRVKEDMPVNIGEYTVPLGVPEVLSEGSDVTLVTYGACVRVAQEAVKMLADVGISVELIDVQTLLPFDRYGHIGESIKKTNAAVFLDEDVPGGASAFMMQEVLEKQGAYEYLDAAPRTISAREHRSAYASDGDYYSKPNAEDIFEVIYGMMRERNPGQFPAF